MSGARVWTVTYMDTERRLIPVRVEAVGFSQAATFANDLCKRKGWATGGWQIVSLERSDAA